MGPISMLAEIQVFFDKKLFVLKCCIMVIATHIKFYVLGSKSRILKVCQIGQKKAWIHI